jgi:hypothetical protein
LWVNNYPGQGILLGMLQCRVAMFFQPETGAGIGYGGGMERNHGD